MSTTKQAESQLDICLEICITAHEGQTRRGGAPYSCHPCRVADRMETEEGKCIALLHDVLEDTQYEDCDLKRLGVSREIIGAVLRMTHQKGDSYEHYIDILCHCYRCRQVKIMDILDNLLDSPSKNQLLKYEKALKMLVRHNVGRIM